MDRDVLIQVAVLLVVGLVWLLINVKAGQTWLKLVSMIGLLGFLGAASWIALVAVF